MGANTNNGSPKAISTKLSLMFVALLLVSILVAEGVTFALGFGMIKDLIYTSLKIEVSADAD
jgi:methyl-accepting chemotaxis protein